MAEDEQNIHTPQPVHSETKAPMGNYQHVENFGKQNKIEDHGREDEIIESVRRRLKKAGSDSTMVTHGAHLSLDEQDPIPHPTQVEQDVPEIEVNIIPYEDDISVETSTQINQLLQEAKEFMNKHLPEATPTQPTSVLLTAEDGGATGGSYMFKLGDRHYIRLVVDQEKLYDPVYRQTLLSTLSHEYTHQRHAEVAGQDGFIGRDFNEIVTEDEISHCKRGQEIEDLLTCKLDKPMEYSELNYVVSEGVALSAEMYVLTKRAEEALASGDNTLAETLKRIKTNTMRGVMRYCMSDRLVSKEGKVSSEERDEPLTVGAEYRMGLEMMQKLAKNFGGEQVKSLIAKIDMKACRRIKAYEDPTDPDDYDTPLTPTKEYQSILDDPSLLPGLNSSVSHST